MVAQKEEGRGWGGKYPDKTRKNCDYHGLLASDGTHTADELQGHVCPIFQGTAGARAAVQAVEPDRHGGTPASVISSLYGLDQTI